jgi:hypothetical protein
MRKFLGWVVPVIVVLVAMTEYSRADQKSGGLSPKAYKTMEETYRNRAAGKKPARPTYVCAMCGLKAKVPGDCPRCGMEMVRDHPEPEKSLELPYLCGHCGLQSAEEGTCPRCGGELKKKKAGKTKGSGK